MPNKSKSAPSPTSMLKGKATTFAGKQVVEGARKLVSKMGGNGGNGDRQPAHATSIIEDIDVGVPVRVAYEQWTQFRKFPEFAKSAKHVDKDGSKQVRWQVKVWWSTREWTSTITEQTQDKRIAWTSEGDKGSIDGVVTFHEVAPELTKVLMTLEYHPKGMFEHVGNLWRAQGRRARLDLKRFRSHVMQQHAAGTSRSGSQRPRRAASKSSTSSTNRKASSAGRKAA